MIRLNVEKYCENCPDFDPEKTMTQYYSGYNTVHIDTEIICSKATKCRCIMEYLKSEKENENAECQN